MNSPFLRLVLIIVVCLGSNPLVAMAAAQDAAYPCSRALEIEADASRAQDASQNDRALILYQNAIVAFDECSSSPLLTPLQHSSLSSWRSQARADVIDLLSRASRIDDAKDQLLHLGSDLLDACKNYDSLMSPLQGNASYSATIYAIWSNKFGTLQIPFIKAQCHPVL
jgi:hypothetical protein